MAQFISLVFIPDIYGDNGVIIKGEGRGRFFFLLLRHHKVFLIICFVGYYSFFG